MLIVKINPKKSDAAVLGNAVACLKRGGLVVYPTETAYALGCDPSNARAVRKLFLLKGRGVSKPLPLIAASTAMTRGFFVLDHYAAMLADAFWPGPLTIVGAQRKQLTPGIASKKNEIAIRVSSHPVALALSGLLGKPIVSTSANRSGRPTPYDVPAVIATLGFLPDLILDTGPLKKNAPSTLVRARNGVVEILRQGPISEDDLHRALMRRL